MTRFDALFTTRHVLQFSDVDVDTFGSIGQVWGEGHVSECYIYSLNLAKPIFDKCKLL